MSRENELVAELRAEDTLLGTRAAMYIASLEEALTPFAEIAEQIAKANPGWDHDEFTIFLGDYPLHLAPFRRARALLGAKQ